MRMARRICRNTAPCESTPAESQTSFLGGGDPEDTSAMAQGLQRPDGQILGLFGSFSRRGRAAYWPALAMQCGCPEWPSRAAEELEHLKKKKPAPARARNVRRQLERSRAKLERERERLFLLSPGGSSERPISVEAAAIVEVRAAAVPCPLCQGPHELLEHAAVVLHGERLREARLRCRRCGTRRSLFFQLEQPVLN